jgi:hypothetical protein
MRRLGLIALLLTGGCGLHLGENYGRRMRAAFDAQIAARDPGTLAIEGEDAKGVLARHRGRGGPGTIGGQTGASVTGGTFVGGSGSSSPSMPSMGRSSPDSPIRLDAVR